MEEFNIVGLAILFGILAGWIDYKSTTRFFRAGRKPLRNIKVM